MTKQSAFDIDDGALDYVTRFPNPLALLRHSMPPLRDVYNDAVVVLDTNALLVPYRTSTAGMNSILKTLKFFKKNKRLAVPEHVLREFAANRVAAISDIYTELKKKRDSVALSVPQIPLLDGITEYRELREAADAAHKSKQQFDRHAEALLKVIQEWRLDDPVHKAYRLLFDDDVVAKIDVSPDDLQREFIRRCDKKIPPGYKDAAKDQNAAGDFVIWRTVLEIGKTTKKHAMIVSSDRKADWCHKASGEVLLPRIEMISEYQQCSDGQSVYLLSLADLLELQNIDESIVSEVRLEEHLRRKTTEEMSLRRKFALSWGKRAKDAIIYYLVNNGERRVVSEAYDQDANWQVILEDHLGSLSVTIITVSYDAGRYNLNRFIYDLTRRVPVLNSDPSVRNAIFVACRSPSAARDAIRAVHGLGTDDLRIWLVIGVVGEAGFDSLWQINHPDS